MAVPGSAERPQDEELAGLREEAARLRAEVAALRMQALLASEDAAQGSERDVRMAQMREANENLVRAAMHAQGASEAAERSNREKEQFLAMLAHELRNPLAPIVNALAMLRRITAADPKLPWIHDVLKRQVDQMTELLDDLLEVSRVTSGKIVLKRRPIDTSEFMLNAIEVSRPLIQARNQKLCVNLPTQPLAIEGDPTRLAQIFGNLLNNASKYTPEAGSIEFSAERKGDTVALRVVDNGIGIAAEMLPRIFELFTQEGRSLDQAPGGLGIGLTVARNLVELHGGTLEARSAGVGLGSEFVVLLPLLHDVLVSPLRPGMTDTESPRESYRIVLIEDNVDASDSLKGLLQMVGHEVFVAFDGRAGVALVEETKPHIVLCDIGLPELDGYQVIAKLREAATSAMPVMIALTGYGQSTDRTRSLAEGFDHYLTKPVDIEALLRLIAGEGERASRLPKDAS
jgi:signal transduction histidine kinase/CheY-like chemotaxis protein